MCLFCKHDVFGIIGKTGKVDFVSLKYKVYSKLIICAWTHVLAKSSNIYIVEAFCWILDLLT